MKVYKILAIINIVLITYNFCMYRYIKTNYFELKAMGSRKEDIYALINMIILIITMIIIILFILGI